MQILDAESRDIDTSASGEDKGFDALGRQWKKVKEWDVEDRALFDGIGHDRVFIRKLYCYKSKILKERRYLDAEARQDTSEYRLKELSHVFECTK